MRRLLFRWRNIEVWSYPAMLYVGLVAGVVAGNIAAHGGTINRWRVFVATLMLIPAALIGARLLYVASHWALYREHLPEIWNRNEGGWSLYGGFPVAVVLSIPLLRVLNLGFGAFWDIATFTILVGMMFTRVGCLLNGCCSGRPSDSWLSMRLPNHRGVWERRVPSQMLEALWGGIILLATIAVRDSMPFPGALFLFAVGAYAAGRFVMEFGREREPGETAFSAEHVISLVTVLVSVSVLTKHWGK